MTVVDVSETLPTNPTAVPWKTRTLAAIKWLVLHHAASAEDATVEELNRAHHARDWWKLSYHYCLAVDGTVYKVNKATEITYTVASGNTPALSVCLIGNRSVVPCPPKQWGAAVELFQALRDAYPGRMIYGHKECPTSPPQATQCPGLLLDLKAFRQAVDLQEA